MATRLAQEILAAASRGSYAVGAFNVTSPLQMAAVLEAAADKRSPVLIQTSVTPSKFYGPKFWATLFRTLAADAGVPAALHLDHCTDIGHCLACVDAGYTSVMIDASKQIFEENVRQTREVCEYAHAHGVAVEGELGTVSGVEDQVKVVDNEASLCDPPKAVEFVRLTGVDYFAPAIGTAHGVYAVKNPKIDFERLARVQSLVNGGSLVAPLVIHGGTSLPEETVRELVRLGGSKVNVSTELKHALIDTEYDYMSAHRDEYDPGKIDAAVKAETKRRIFAWMTLLGSVNRA
ncbi:MAG TPA: class II fructose-bisphosphate aldolase [Spirochaetia bacterium]|nr:class II fructose-bisphosphate aldolase [Spirochaetia bacterium]